MRLRHASPLFALVLGPLAFACSGTSGDDGPIDAAAPDISAIDAGAPDAGATDVDTSDASTNDAGVASPLMLTVTVHLENHPPYDLAWADGLRAFATAFEAHGARLTLEPRQEVLMGTSDARSVLVELEGHGHSVGSHAATGSAAGLTEEGFAAILTMRRASLDAVVDQVDHVSGICSTLDFVTAASAAGFTYTTGATAACLTAMAPADRPAGYTSFACPMPTSPGCHTGYPTDVAARIRPWRALDAAHWLTDDPHGVLVVLPGSGTLPCLEEEAQSSGALPSNCVLDAADQARATADLDDAIAHLDPQRPNTFYWVWGNFDPSNVDYDALDAVLDAIDVRIAAGTVQWATASEMYQAFVAWEATHR